MYKKKIKLDGIDKDYTFYVAVVTPKEAEAIAGRPVGACFTKDVAYFCDFSGACISHECIHIAIEYMRKSDKEIDFNEMLLDKRPEAARAGEEAFAHSFTYVYNEVIKVLRNLVAYSELLEGWDRDRDWY